MKIETKVRQALVLPLSHHPPDDPLSFNSRPGFSPMPLTKDRDRSNQPQLADVGQAIPLIEQHGKH
ncbi:MAG TPA: hypothetical protein VJA19_07490 [Pseudomonas sp.]|nr:hypothetical protein [Pseudomonas sp.]